MAATFSRLGFESFEERSLPSATPMAVAEISPSEYIRTVLSEQTDAASRTQSDSSASEYQMIPLGFNRAGNLLVLIVKTNPAPVDHSVIAQSQSQSFRADTSEDSLPSTLRSPNAIPGSNPSLLVANESFEIPGNVDASRIVSVREIPLADNRMTSNLATTGTMFASLTPVAGNDWSLGESIPPMMLPEFQPSPDLGPDVAEIPQATSETPKSPSISVEELGSYPLSGLLPFNLPHLEQAVSGLLSQVRAIGDSLAGEIGDSSDAWWLAAAALTAGGTVWSIRTTQQNRRSHTTRTRRSYLIWQGADGARID